MWSGSWLLCLMPAAVFGALLLGQALRVRGLIFEDQGSCAGDWMGEVCTWLTNTHDPKDSLNEARRAALGSLWGWALLGAGMLSLQSLGTSAAGALRRGLQGAAGLYALLACYLAASAPSAHVIAHQGLKYPVVKQLRDGCAPELARALRAGTCTLWDVSDGALEDFVVLQGPGCGSREPGEPDWRRLRRTPDGRCVLEKNGSEVLLTRG